VSTAEAIRILTTFQAWRTGRDERTYDEIGITPKQITGAIEHAIKVMEGKRPPVAADVLRDAAGRV
jgi:hypothetical protein